MLQGSLRSSYAFMLELVLQGWGCVNHRVCISLLSYQETNVWGLVSDVDQTHYDQMSDRRYAFLMPLTSGHVRAANLDCRVHPASEVCCSDTVIGYPAGMKPTGQPFKSVFGML
jgi:hypothetical protein